MNFQVRNVLHAVYKMLCERVDKILYFIPEATKYMINKAKQLFDENGILTLPAKKKGRALNPETKALVQSFYCNDEVSRLMPGKKDFISIKENGVRRHEQKRLVLGNLKELYSLFGTQHPDNHIGFSTFADLRPENCILAGSSGTHTVCVCSIHQNPILMLDACKRSISLDTHFDFNYKSVLKIIICEEPTRACYFGECKQCPGVEYLKQRLVWIFDEEGVETIQFKQWVSTDRATLETFVKSTDQFIDSLLEKLVILSKHSFIAKKQSEYLDCLKKNLPVGHVLVLGDFAENMSFVVQDEVQGFHWNNDQATIHPMVFYYKNSEGALDHGNFVPLSECLHHDSTLVHVFLERFNIFLKSKLNPTKIIYFTDGCAAQYKNRNNFYNMTLHEHDFGVPADWHFYATSHGKSACDGLGGTIKRLVTKASLQRPLNDQILTPLQMFHWAKRNISGINFVYVTNEDYEAIQNQMDSRYLKTVVLDGTRSFHCFIPISEGIIKVKVYSSDEEHFFKRVVKIKSQLETRTKLLDVKKMT